ncbi:hypothetical protein FOMPIDRAFT_1055639 [Fomitopsis schrenkii]|uniref:Cerato-platanin n=1 Tax=Fomitopsis schrenkii TaxID=2126942 RepID=S8DRL2_FOMSC|nr:hypothetical protein FOMPIDRAFT_1055639 [Fomitopsis schrenkii]
MRSLTIYQFIVLLASSKATAQSGTFIPYPVYGNGVQFENPNASVYTLACGPVLAAQGYTTIGQITGPGLAGFVNVTGPDSSLCGQCAVLGENERTVAVQIVDASTEGGFVLTPAV